MRCREQDDERDQRHRRDRPQELDGRRGRRPQHRHRADDHAEHHPGDRRRSPGRSPRCAACRRARPERRPAELGPRARARIAAGGREVLGRQQADAAAAPRARARRSRPARASPSRSRRRGPALPRRCRPGDRAGRDASRSWEQGVQVGLRGRAARPSRASSASFSTESVSISAGHFGSVSAFRTSAGDLGVGAEDRRAPRPGGRRRRPATPSSPR